MEIFEAVPEQKRKDLERVKGIEPSYEAWEAAVLPLNYTRVGAYFNLQAEGVDAARRGDF